VFGWVNSQKDLFFRFPWNNFLHSVVYDMFAKVFNTFSFTLTVSDVALADEEASPSDSLKPKSREAILLEEKISAIRVNVRDLVVSVCGYSVFMRLDFQ
jgi:hypothetical protein